MHCCKILYVVTDLPLLNVGGFLGNVHLRSMVAQFDLDFFRSSDGFSGDLFPVLQGKLYFFVESAFLIVSFNS